MKIKSVGFLGAGQMATALAGGVTAGELMQCDGLYFCDANQAQLDSMAKRFAGCHVTNHSSQLFKDCNLIILSVKPQVLTSILGQLRPHVTPEHVLISIAAGISLAQLQDSLRTKNIVRVMPNTPAQVSAGVSALCSDLADDSDAMLAAQKIFETVGQTVIVQDHQMDAVTGLSGSGPAFVLMMIESLCDAGVANGLSRAVAMILATQTVLGSAKMVQQTGLHPAVLKDQVTSPAGTTIAGIRSLEANHFRSSVIEAVCQATFRSEQLRKPSH